MVCLSDPSSSRSQSTDTSCGAVVCDRRKPADEPALRIVVAARPCRFSRPNVLFGDVKPLQNVAVENGPSTTCPVLSKMTAEKFSAWK